MPVRAPSTRTEILIGRRLLTSPKMFKIKCETKTQNLKYLIIFDN